MSSPSDRIPDLSLERLGERDGARGGHIGDAAHVRILERAAQSVGGFSAAYQALIDAVFTAPGAAEWLNGMWKRVTALLAEREAPQPKAAPSDAIRAAAPDPSRI